MKELYKVKRADINMRDFLSRGTYMNGNASW